MIERFRELMSYDPVEGRLSWRVSRGGTARAGADAGTVDKWGQIVVKVDYRSYRALAVCYAMHNGVMPAGAVRPINGDYLDLRAENLVLSSTLLRFDPESADAAEVARELLAYDPETGVLRWRLTRSGVRVGDVAGLPNGDGYLRVALGGRRYLAHRVAWLIVHGHLPSNLIDHINGVVDDNRLANLREATQAENVRNSRIPSNNTSGIKGVRRNGRGWQARITVNGVTHHFPVPDPKTEFGGRFTRAWVGAWRHILHGRFARQE